MFIGGKSFSDDGLLQCAVKSLFTMELHWTLRKIWEREKGLLLLLLLSS